MTREVYFSDTMKMQKDDIYLAYTLKLHNNHLCRHSISYYSYSKCIHYWIRSKLTCFEIGFWSFIIIVINLFTFFGTLRNFGFFRKLATIIELWLEIILLKLCDRLRRLSSPSSEKGFRLRPSCPAVPAVSPMSRIGNEF